MAINKVKNYLLGTGQFESKYHGERCKKITYINIPPKVVENLGP